MSDEPAKAIERGAKRLGHAVGTALKRAESKLLRDTETGLRASAESHLKHDGEAAEGLERAARGPRSTPVVSGGRTAPPGASAPRTASVPNVNLVSGSNGATSLPNPTGRLSSSDYPYLRPAQPVRETEAVPGAAPNKVSWVAPGTYPGRTVPPAGIQRTFAGEIQPYTLRKGVTYYRSVGDGQYPTGGFWSETPPVDEASLRRDYAVLNDWNGDHGVVSFTPDRDVPVAWEGEVGPQGASVTGHSGDQDPNHHLPGGARQIWIPRGGIDHEPGEWWIAPA